MAKAFNPISPEWEISRPPFLPSRSLPPTFRQAFVSLSPARALLTRESEEDGQTTSQGFLKPATSA